MVTIYGNFMVTIYANRGYQRNFMGHVPWLWIRSVGPFSIDIVIRNHWESMADSKTVYPLVMSTVLLLKIAMKPNLSH